MPSISIIVPIYNAQTTLPRCVESILAQTFEDFELILIDDGSTDKSAEISERYTSIDSRVYYYYKNNGGVSSARNLGLFYAQGIWVTFVDSDDAIGKDYLLNLYENAKEGVDIVMSYPVLIYSNGYRYIPKYEPNIYDINNFDRVFLNNELHKYTSPWAKLYKRSILKNFDIKFCEDMHIGEDMVFLYTYLLHINKFSIINNTDYLYSFEQQNSLTKRINSVKSEYLGYVNVKNVIDQLICKWGISSEIALHSLAWIKGYYVRRVLNALYNPIYLKQSYRLEIIKKLDIETYYEELHIPAVKEKLLAILLKIRLVCLYDYLRVLSAYIKKIIC